MAYTTIPKPTDYFNTKLYSGNASTNAITGVGFQPDMTWLKQRNGTPDHYLFDAVRGVLNYLTPNLATQQQANVVSLTAFNSDGFTLGSNGQINASSSSNVSWNWKANGAGSANTDGTINTIKTSANTTSGFSMSTYTGTGSNATVGHGLGKVPKVIMVKNLSVGETDWMVYHASLGATKNMRLNNTDAIATSSAMWNNTTPTSSLFYLSNNGNVNASGQAFIAYCFADVQGFSKMGSYKGNGNADGTFVYTGFKPAWVMIKNTTSSASWNITDAKRDTFNVAGKGLFANETTAESAIAGREIDFLSNGFKIRTSGGEKNTSGNIYIYMAFAEEPFVSTNGQPATAR